MVDANQGSGSKPQKNLAWIVVSLLIVVGVIVAIAAYSTAQTSLLYSQAESSAEKTAELGAKEISATIEYGKSSIKSAANSLSASMTSDTLEDPQAAITPLLENTPFDAIEYIRADGMNVMNAGAPFDASDRTYYIEGIKGNTGIWNNYHPKTTKDVLMNFYTPLIRNGEVIGVITGYIEGNTTLAPTMEADFFGQKTYGLLFDADNMVIAYTNSGDFQADFTLEEYLGTYGFSDEQKEKLLQSLTSGDEGVVRFDSPDGEGLVCIAKVPNTDWTTATFIPATSINAVMNASRTQTMALVVALVVLALAMLAVIILRARRERRKLTEENATLDRIVSERTAELQRLNEEQEARIEEVTTLNGELEVRQTQLEEATAEQEAQIEEISVLNGELEDQREVLERRLHVIRSLSNRYFAAYFVDIVSDTYTEIASIGNIQQHYEAQGCAQAALTGMVPVLMHPEFKERMQAFVDLSTVKVKLKNTESITQRYIGNTTGWSEASFVVCDRDEDGTPTSVIFCAREVNEEVEADLKHRQELEVARDAANAANDAKTNFLFSMSHDIRTPMNAIVGYTNLLKKDSSDAEKRAAYLDRISSSSDFLLGLINNVLEMARIDSGKMVLDETACSMREVNDTLFSVFEGEMTKKGINYTRSADIEHEYVLCDAVKLREVFLNLLSNALKYTPAGGSVSVDLRELPEQLEGYACYQTKISDTGIGMSADFLPHLFEEFTRERTSTESRVQGTGLGMPIVKKLIDLMGGTIEVESELGRGTTFTITLRHKISSEEALRRVEAGVEVQVDLAGKRILLAEDNDLNAEIAIEILGETGAEIDRAEDGIICVDMLEKAPEGYYDLILMDIQMPNMDGYKATHVIRRIPDAMKANIPIIAMTANAFEEDRRAAIEAGMNAHVAKPIDVPTFMATIASVLGSTSVISSIEESALASAAFDV